MKTVIAAASIVGVAILIVVFNGGLSVGFSNHAVLVPVVRRMLNPAYLPGDFGIALRWYHHRAFLYVVAAATWLLGEDRALIGLAVAGKLFLSFALFMFCRILGLSNRAFWIAGLFVAFSMLWTGRGLETNSFVGGPEIMPPTFAFALILLVVGCLLEKRLGLAAFLSGLVFLIHMQIGFIFAVVVLPFFITELRDSTVRAREALRLTMLAAVSSLPAIWWLVELSQRGLVRSSSLNLVEFRMPHHFELISPTRVSAVCVHLIVQGVLYGWLRREGREEARPVGMLFGMSLVVGMLSLLHVLDYYVGNGTIAQLQFIRVTPLVTVFGTVSLLLGIEAWARTQVEERNARRTAHAILLAAMGVWLLYRLEQGTLRATGVRKYADTDSGWVDMCRWIKQHGPHDAVYLTPPGEEGFTYLSDRSNVVEFKNNPDGGLYLDEWLTRLRDLAGGTLPAQKGFENEGLLNHSFAMLTAEQLAELGEKFRARYAVLPRESEVDLAVLYQNKDYRMVSVRAPEGPP